MTQKKIEQRISLLGFLQQQEQYSGSTDNTAVATALEWLGKHSNDNSADFQDTMFRVIIYLLDKHALRMEATKELFSRGVGIGTIDEVTRIAARLNMGIPQPIILELRTVFAH